MRINGSRRDGTVLLLALVVMTLLSILALSLRRGVGIEFSMARYAMGETRARYAAAGGLVWAIEELRQDSTDEASRAADTLYACGVRMAGDESLPQRFAPIELDGAAFQVADPGGWPGLTDQERFINVNTLPAAEWDVLAGLAELSGADQDAARRFAAAVIDGRDRDSEVFQPPYGAEGPEDIGQAFYPVRNAPFDHPSELTSINGMTPEVWSRLRLYVTVWPASGRFQVNLNTAPPLVLLALAQGLTGPGTSRDDAGSLVDKVLRLRRGPDGKDGTSDDVPVALQELSLNARERNLFLSLARYHSPVSRIFQARITGRDHATGIRKTITAIIRRQDLAVLSWETE